LRGRLFIALLAVVVAVQASVIAHRRLAHLGDFDVSRELGRRWLAGEPLYAGGLHYPYMPTAALYFAPLAWLPPGWGLALRYAAALGCLWLTLRMLHTMVCARRPALAGEGLGLAAVTLLFASHYVLRDLDDGGPHLILLAMLVGGIYCLWRGRVGTGAAWFGLAAALKAPNALFLPFFAWTRQWRLAALSSAALLAWTVLPLVWMGPAPWWQHQREWLRVAFASATGVPSGGARESEERLQNQALRPTLARYCRAPGVAASPPAVQSDAPGPTGPASPCYFPTLATVAAIGLVAWWIRARSARHPARRPGLREQSPGLHDPLLTEASAVLILSVLLSPVAWVQHLVVVIPALYLIAAQRRTDGLGGAATAAMVLYFVLSVLLNREVLGRDRYLFLLAHGLHTLCMLIVLAVLGTLSLRDGVRGRG